MHINKRILSIPPYISTTWKNVKSLHTEDATLVVSLCDGQVIKIPELTPEIIEAAFSMHAAFAEHQTETYHKNTGSVSTSEDMMFRFGFSGLDGLGTALQHNSSQMNAPDIPVEVLEKIASFAKVIMPNDPNAIPKPEPHCNCMHCQIARAIQGEMEDESFQEEQQEKTVTEVSDEELTFCQWDIQQSGDKLYTVTNRLNNQEKYNVYLGHPIGCTCGQEGCEHIIAVLKN